MRKCLAVLLVLGAVSVSQAVMLADFETGLDGFRATGSPASTLSLSTKEGAVTSGSQCLKVDHKAGNYWPLQWVAPSVPARLGKLSIDITCFAADWPTQPWTRFCERLRWRAMVPAERGRNTQRPKQTGLIEKQEQVQRSIGVPGQAICIGPLSLIFRIMI